MEFPDRLPDASLCSEDVMATRLRLSLLHPGPSGLAAPGRKSAPHIYAEERRSHASRYPRVRIAVTGSFLLPSIVFSNIVFFNLFDDFSRYGFYGFIFWANLLLMMALYVEFLPSVLRRSRGTKVE
jgi:hypothetical protein